MMLWRVLVVSLVAANANVGTYEVVQTKHIADKSTDKTPRCAATSLNGQTLTVSEVDGVLHVKGMGGLDAEVVTLKSGYGAATTLLGSKECSNGSGCTQGAQDFMLAFMFKDDKLVGGFTTAQGWYRENQYFEAESMCSHQIEARRK